MHTPRSVHRRMGASSFSALLAKAGVLATAFAVAFMGIPTAGAEPVDATATDGTRVKETGLAPDDSQWTSIDSNGEISVVPGAAGAPDTAPGESAYTELNQEMPTSLTPNSSPVNEDEQPLPLDPLLPQKTDLAEPDEISVHRDGISDEGDQIYRLDATVEFSLAETIGTDDVSFLRGNATAEIADIESVTINNEEVDVTEDVELFSYPRPGSGVFLPNPWPEDVTGDMITIDTQGAFLTEETSFSVTFTLKDDTQDETPWKRYTGQDTAKTLNEKLDGAKPEARVGGSVPSNQVRVVVQVGGDRLLGNQQNAATRVDERNEAVFRYSGEPGAVLQLYRPLHNNTFTNYEAGRENTVRDPEMVPIEQDWATCTSDTKGECTFDIPTSGPDTYPYYWIAMTEASPGFEVQRVVRAGGSGSDLTEGGLVLRYAYATPNIEDSGGKTFYSGTFHQNVSPNEGWGADHEYRDRSRWEPSSFMWEVQSRRDRVFLQHLEYRTPLGIFQQRRTNPPLSNRCGLRVGFIVDTSGSMADGIGTMRKILTGKSSRRDRNPVQGVFDALANTSTEVGLVTFSTNSPGSRSEPNIVSPLKLNSENDRRRATEWANGLGARGDTNWEDGLKQFADYNDANPGAKYDVVYMITDGNPTRNITGNRFMNGFDTEYRHVEAAMGMSNTLKSQGTRVVPVGIPSNWPSHDPSAQLNLSENNLEAISGVNPDGTSPTLRYSNFLTYTDSDVFRQALINTLNTCAISVERRFYEGDDTPSEGPTISNTRATTKEENNRWGYEGKLSPEGRQTEHKTEYPHIVAGPDVYHATFTLNGETPYSEVEIREQKRVPEGWQRMPVKGGDNAQCFDANHNPVDVTNLDQSGDPPTNDFKLNNVPMVGGIHCIVYYRKQVEPTGFNFHVAKVDAENNATSLEGAKFELRPLNEDGSRGEPIPNAGVPAPESSKFEWNDLEPGRYVLIETQSPTAQDGKTYSLLAQPIYFSVTAEGDGYKVKLLDNAQDRTGKELNQKNLTFPIVGFNLTNQQADQPQLLKFEVANVHVGNLPKTGGIGVAPWILVALTMMLLGGTLTRKRVQ